MKKDPKASSSSATAAAAATDGGGSRTMPEQANNSFSSNSLAEIPTTGSNLTAKQFGSSANPCGLDSDTCPRPFSPPSSANDCLETSLQILHTSVEHAKEHAGQCYDKTQREWCATTTPPRPPTSNSKKKDGGSGGSGSGGMPSRETMSPASYRWWMSMFQRQQETHSTDRQKWQTDLKKAQTQGDRLKRELQSHMTDRLQWLEERLESTAVGNGHFGDSACGTGGIINLTDHDGDTDTRQGVESEGSRSSGEGSDDTTEAGYEVDDERSNRRNNNKFTTPRSTRSGAVGGVGVVGGGADEVLQSRRTATSPRSGTVGGADEVLLSRRTLMTDEGGGGGGESSGDKQGETGVQQQPPGVSPRAGMPTVQTQPDSSTVSALGVASDLTDASALVQYHNQTVHPDHHPAPAATGNNGLYSNLGTTVYPMDETDGSASVEVRYDNSVVLQRLGELERAVQFHEEEKCMAFEQANRVKEQGEQLSELSETMQGQLIQLMREVETASWKQTTKWKEKVAVQKQLLDLLEQQQGAAKKEWKKERDLLENTIAQLSADKVQLQQDYEAEKKRNPQEEARRWKHEKEVFSNTLTQLSADKMALRDKVKQLRASRLSVEVVGEGDDNAGTGKNSADEQQGEGAVLSSPPSSPKSCLKKKQSRSPSRDNNSPAAAALASPRRVEWEDKLERALLERDTYRQELEQAKKALEEAGGNLDTYRSLQEKEEEWKQATERRVTELRDECTGVIDNLKRQLDAQKESERAQQASPLRKVASEGDYSVNHERQLREDAQHLLRTREALWKQETERKLKQLRDEYDEVMEALEQQLNEKDSDTRYRESVEKRNELVSRLRAIEIKHDEEKGEWKLRLEGALAKAKDAMETEFQQAREEYAKDVQELTAQLEAVQDRYDQATSELIRLQQRDQENLEPEGLTEQRETLEKDLEELKEVRARETEQLEGMVEAARHGNQDRMEELMENHAQETENLREQLEASEEESRALIDKTNVLVHSLENLKDSHRKAKEKWELEMQTVIVEKDKQIFQLEMKVTKAEHHRKSLSDNRPPLAEVQQTICGAVEELRQDVVAVRETVETSSRSESTTAQANHIELSENINLMQSSLNDSLAELTLGTEAMIEVKEMAEALVVKGQQQQGLTVGDSSTRNHHQHEEAILKEIARMRELLSSIVEVQSDGAATILQDSMRQELITELQKKETELAALMGELLHMKTELASETKKLQDAELEIAALNDQADAYSDELMRMQSLTAGMEETLKTTEQKMESALHQSSKNKSDDDSSPLLDEALALAKGLTSLVHGDEDADVMDLLRNMSDLMDQQERGGLSPSDEEDNNNDNARAADTPSKIHSTRSALVRGEPISERPPEPVETPDRFAARSTTSSEECDLASPSRSAASTSLQMVVEQLYGRCQLLERERTQMMEVTLDLLTSARQANAAEMDAALATARRKAMEEVTRVHQQTQLEKERLYRKLCGNCVEGIATATTATTTATATTGGD